MKKHVCPRKTGDTKATEARKMIYGRWRALTPHLDRINPTPRMVETKDSLRRIPSRELYLRGKKDQGATVATDGG